MEANMHTDPSLTPTRLQSDAIAFYNMLMWDIEPELTTDLLPDLDLLYAEEPKEDRALRLQWYEDAFALFRERAKDLKAQGKETLQKALKNVAKLSLDRARGSEMHKISSIEDSLAES